jgi:hypothetical protein
MFRWYQNSSVCYAYLFDVTASAVNNGSSDFGDSVWFTRGWCLQELLASKALTFFNCDWKSLGTKEELSQITSEITGIHHEALCGRDLEDFSVAQRMAWASNRVTTRVEDIAYSLLGIFRVNMPLLYGEGERAFVRLQEEVMKRSNDQSIFVHSSSGQSQRLLAVSPADFRESSSIVRPDKRLITGEPYNLTNMGLFMELLLYPWTLDTYIALLDCRDELAPDDHVGIFVTLQPQVFNLDGSPSTDHAIRIKIDGQAWTSHPPISKLPSTRNRIYLEHELSGKMSIPPKKYGYWIRRFEGENAWAKDGKIWAISWNKWDSAERILEIPDGSYTTAGIVMWEVQDDGTGHPFYVPLRLAFAPGFKPVIEFAAEKFLPSAKRETVLPDMRWMKKSSRGDDMLLCGQGRDLPILERRAWGIFGVVHISCQKLQVNGVETWVVDVTWRMGHEGLPKQISTKWLGDICDACNLVSPLGRV